MQMKERALKVRWTGAGGEGGHLLSPAPRARGGQKLLVPLDTLFPEKSLQPPNVGRQVDPGQTAELADYRVGQGKILLPGGGCVSRAPCCP